MAQWILLSAGRKQQRQGLIAPLKRISHCLLLPVVCAVCLASSYVWLWLFVAITSHAACRLLPLLAADCHDPYLVPRFLRGIEGRCRARGV